jgi:hypothetical protein
MLAIASTLPKHREKNDKPNERGGELMAENNNAPIEAVRGIVSGAIGFTKQVIGLILSRSDLQEEGRAQVDKASNQLEAAGKEAEAEKARAKAKVQETRQKAASSTK